VSVVIVHQNESNIDGNVSGSSTNPRTVPVKMMTSDARTTFKNDNFDNPRQTRKKICTEKPLLFLYTRDNSLDLRNHLTFGSV